MAGKKFKLLLESGITRVCSAVRGARETAEAAGSAVSALASATAESLDEVDKALDKKADSAAALELTETEYKELEAMLQ